MGYVCHLWICLASVKSTHRTYIGCSERRLIGHSFYRPNFLRKSCATCREKCRRAAPRTEKPAQWTLCSMVLKILPFSLYTSPVSVQALQSRSCLSYTSKSESELLHDWQFMFNQFVLAPSPLRVTIRGLSLVKLCHHVAVLITRFLVIQFSPSVWYSVRLRSKHLPQKLLLERRQPLSFP
jgi:hypothetical protein